MTVRWANISLKGCRKALTIKEEIDTSDFIIIKSFSVFNKITIKRAKRQTIKYKNIFATMFSKKGLNSITLL